MFSGGDYEEVARWLTNFVRSHAKREGPRAEAVIDTAGPRAGQSYGVRVRLGDRLEPPAGEPPLHLAYGDVAANRGSMQWCADLAARVRSLVRAAAEASRGSRQTA
jgi:hypothetical protein